MANEKILVVDDDTNICELLRLYLTKEGYQVTVANDGEEGLEKFNQVKPDMVLLDVMMPKMDGLEVCRRIRKAGNTPVMMLTAKGETFDKVLGLELGADDYMVKPFDAKEVVARIKAVLRRCQTTTAAAESTEGVIEFDNLRLDMNSYELRVKGKVVEAPPKELELLNCLASHPNRVYTRDQLLDEVWGFEYYGDSRTIDVHVKRLREKLAGASDLQFGVQRVQLCALRHGLAVYQILCGALGNVHHLIQRFVAILRKIIFEQHPLRAAHQHDAQHHQGGHHGEKGRGDTFTHY